MHGPADLAGMETEAAIREGSIQVTALLLVAAGVLLVLGVAGVGASLPLVGLLLALAVVLYATRSTEPTVGRVGGLNVDHLLGSLWLAVVVATLPLVFELSATPEEVQALGGLLGLAGMVNYFVRPLYLLAYDLVSSLLGTGEGRANGR
jgi:hypothetical protein